MFFSGTLAAVFSISSDSGEELESVYVPASRMIVMSVAESEAALVRAAERLARLAAG